MYSRQVCGLVETGWIVIWVRRFLCLVCGHTMSLLPDWLHPWRWYAGTVIVEALYRHCVLMEPATAISAFFRGDSAAVEWRSLRRWRAQLLISPTLWGWLGPRLDITEPASSRCEGKTYIERLLAEGGVVSNVLKQIPIGVHRTLGDMVHDRKRAWSWRRFPPGSPVAGFPDPMRLAFPTEKDSGPGPP